MSEKGVETGVPGRRFKDDAGMPYKVIAGAYMAGSREPVYICQELREPYETVVWERQDVLECMGGEPDLFAEELEEEKAVIIGSEDTDGLEESQRKFLSDFLESRNLSHKLELLWAAEKWVTEPMLECMALSLDFEIGEGGREKKYLALERFLRTRLKYETRGRDY